MSRVSSRAGEIQQACRSTGGSGSCYTISYITIAASAGTHLRYTDLPAALTSYEEDLPAFEFRYIQVFGRWETGTWPLRLVETLPFYDSVQVISSIRGESVDVCDHAADDFVDRVGTLEMDSGQSVAVIEDVAMSVGEAWLGTRVRVGWGVLLSERGDFRFGHQKVYPSLPGITEYPLSTM